MIFLQQFPFYINSGMSALLFRSIQYSQEETIVVSIRICYTRYEKKGCDCMLATKSQVVVETSDTAKLELYRLIGEGYKAMQEGRTSTIDEVREKLKKRREERG